MTASSLPIDPGLLDRFRTAGRQITWRPAETPRSAAERRSRRSARVERRIARLHEEEALVEEWRDGPARTLLVDSGPVGALVLLLAIDADGTPNSLRAREASERADFSKGAIEARWGPVARDAAPALPIGDVVGLARYALP